MTLQLTDLAGNIATGLTITREWDADLASTDPLRFPGYVPPDAAEEAVWTGRAELGTISVALVHCLFEHRGGTMGAAVGERVVRAFRRALDARLPVATFVATGGVRLQEGMVSLTQMARTVSAVADHRAAGLLTAGVFQHPTTGGVYASWGSLADVRAAEPGATLGFAGPRVVAQVTRSLPPADSHTAEAAYRHGLVDALIARPDQISWLSGVLGGTAAAPLLLAAGRDISLDRSGVPADAWQLLQRARRRTRPSGYEWAAWLTDSWVELRGADPAIRAGLATLTGQRLVVVAMDRHAVGDAGARPGPASYVLAQRAIRLASRLGLPVLTIIDTPGAEPGPVAEAEGVAPQIANTLLAMAEAAVPTVALCVGEAGSGGAMALAHTDRLLMLEGACFTVIGPEAGAVVLYRDTDRAAELARAFRLSARELARDGAVDAVLDERSNDVLKRVRAAVADAIAAAAPGDRNRRADLLTAKNLR